MMASLTADDWLRWVLRLNALLLLCAFPAMFFSRELMGEVHLWLGMGELPQGALVGYLTRSISALYGTCGVATFMLTLDTRRYRSFVDLWGIASILFGAFLLWVDTTEELPRIWTLAEGPYLIPVGLLVLVLNRAAKRYD